MVAVQLDENEKETQLREAVTVCRLPDHGWDAREYFENVTDEKKFTERELAIRLMPFHKRARIWVTEHSKVAGAVAVSSLAAAAAAPGNSSGDGVAGAMMAASVAAAAMSHLGPMAQDQMNHEEQIKQV